MIADRSKAFKILILLVRVYNRYVHACLLYNNMMPMEIFVILLLCKDSQLSYLQSYSWRYYSNVAQRTAAFFLGFTIDQWLWRLLYTLTDSFRVCKKLIARWLYISPRGNVLRV